ncbi:MAG: hypothetical protein DRJ03_07315 [Chloroflexi bacterium]|nr:MAG: hypothetical protein DRJ03_07315 [Chloroflexota bacterium]
MKPKTLLTRLKKMRLATISDTGEKDFGGVALKRLPSELLASAREKYGSHPNPVIFLIEKVFGYVWDAKWVELCWEAALEDRARSLENISPDPIKSLMELSDEDLLTTVVEQWERSVLIMVCWPVLFGWDKEVTATAFMLLDDLTSPREDHIKELWGQDLRFNGTFYATGFWGFMAQKLKEWGYYLAPASIGASLANTYLIWSVQSVVSGYRGNRTLEVAISLSIGGRKKYPAPLPVPENIKRAKDSFRGKGGVSFLNTAEAALFEGLSRWAAIKGKLAKPSAPLQKIEAPKKVSWWWFVLGGGAAGAALTYAAIKGRRG